jgi:hypothetical protein
MEGLVHYVLFLLEIENNYYDDLIDEFLCYGENS